MFKALMKNMTLKCSACMLSQETKNNMLFQGNDGSNIIRNKSNPQKKRDKSNHLDV